MIWLFNLLPDWIFHLIVFVGILGLLTSTFFAIFVIIAKIYDIIPVPGYAATVLTVIFFGGLNSIGLGIVGTYAWRAFENTETSYG